MKSNNYKFLIFLLSGFAFLGTSWAAGSKLINVQGKLTNSQGNLLNGPYVVTFRLYAHANDPINAAIWSESQGIAILNGVLNVTMGNVNPLDPIAFNTPYYLGMQVAGDLNELTPRQLLGASAYALGSLGDFNVHSNLIVSSSATINGSLTVNGQDVQSYLLPRGAILPYAGPIAPTGYLACDGSAVSRTAYAGLFNAIGTTWGAGDGQTTFNLPDLRGRTPIGAGQGVGLTNRPLAQALGEESHVLTIGEMPSHTHSPVGHSHTTGVSGADFVTEGFGSGGLSGGGFNSVTVHTTSTEYAAVNNTGGGGAHNVMQPSAVVNFIIKT